MTPKEARMEYYRDQMTARLRCLASAAVQAQTELDEGRYTSLLNDIETELRVARRWLESLQDESAQ